MAVHRVRVGCVAVLMGLAILVPQIARAQSDLPLEAWDDDWVYPEGRIRVAGKRFSLVVGGIFTRWTNAQTRDHLGSSQIDPNVDLYAPQPKGLTLDLDLNWTGFAQGERSARLIAPTLGLRSIFVEPTPKRPFVPFATLRVGPYFVKTPDLGGHTVPGANASLGVEIDRRVSLALRYDLLRKVEGTDLSNWSVSVLFKVPLRTPVEAARKIKGPLVPPGDLVDIGGYRLHLVCRGEGTPTVVMDAGMSDAWVTWAKVQTRLSRATRVCSYDRAGIGFSDAGPVPRTSSRIVEELHTLLRNAGAEGPYVLVGHSFGGYNVRLFASQHPNEVAGMVLVDASHEDMWDRYPPEMRKEMTKLLIRLQQSAERAERGEPVGPIVPNLPPALASRPAWHRTLFEELRSMEASGAELRAAERSLRVPLVVISAGRLRKDLRQAWEEMQAEMVGLSPLGRRIIGKRSGHYAHRDQPELVAEAIEAMVGAVRRSAPSEGRIGP